MFSSFSVEASIVENGKSRSGMLTLFEDEYVFFGKTYSIDWETVECVEGSAKVKSFFKTAEKPSLVLRSKGLSSPEMVFEPAHFAELKAEIRKIKKNAADEKAAAAAEAAAEEQRRKAEEAEEARQAAEQERIREEAKARAEEEYRLQQERKLQEAADAERRLKEQHEKVQREKSLRIEAAVANSKAAVVEVMTIGGIAKKAASCILENPFRILGISSVATIEEANSALDKLKKLERLHAVDSYSAPFDLANLDRPSRNLSVAQNALASIKDDTHRFFWFKNADSCIAWTNPKYRLELERDGFEHGSYELFLANYLYALVSDPDFNVSETWKRVFRFYCYLVKSNRVDVLKDHIPEHVRSKYSDAEIMRLFKQCVFRPVLTLCARDDLDATLRAYKYVQSCDDELLKGLSGKILSTLTSWFNDKEASALSYLSQNTYEKESLSSDEAAAARRIGEAYCQAVEPVLGVALRSFRGDTAKHDMIKESYRHVTYQYMYELNKCSNKENAIYFANKCYGYCSADDKTRIKNTFGEVNIKAIDWNVPHTGWDAKGDDFFFGRGCEVDYVQALNWYHKAADAGNMYSQNSLGICYKNGTGVPKDINLAVHWFEKAKESGNPDGAFNLAECYYAGEGCRQNTDRALELWAEADKLGHPSASSRRATIFSQIQSKRRAHRAKNHICIDLGFQMPMGSNVFAEVTMSGRGNAYLVNQQGYQNYLEGNTFRFRGGIVTESPYRIQIPSSNHWYLIIDNGDNPLDGLTATAKVKNG